MTGGQLLAAEAFASSVPSAAVCLPDGRPGCPESCPLPAGLPVLLLPSVPSPPAPRKPGPSDLHTPLFRTPPTCFTHPPVSFLLPSGAGDSGVCRCFQYVSFVSLSELSALSLRSDFSYSLSTA